MIAHVEALRALGACAPGVKYAADYATAQAAWNACRRPDWMAWLVARISQRQGVLIACLCARSVARRSGRYQAEIEGLLGQVESWAWGADVNLAPVWKRLYTFRGLAAAAAEAAVGVAYWSGVDAANEAASAASAAAKSAALPGSPTDLCDLIRSAVPVCPLEVMP